MTWVPKNRATDGEDDDSKNGDDDKGKNQKKLITKVFFCVGQDLISQIYANICRVFVRVVKHFRSWSENNNLQMFLQDLDIM